MSSWPWRSATTAPTLHHLGETASIAELVRRVHADLEVTANPLVPADLRGVALSSLRTG